MNPIYGSAGLLWSGNWQLCQAAVEAVLGGAPITKLSPDSAACTMSPSLKACDIRHVSKEENSGAGAGEAGSRDLHKVKSRGRFKRVAAGKPKQRAGSPDVDDAARVMWSWSHKEGSPSRESGLSQHAEEQSGDANCASVETVETSLAKAEEESDVELELTLGWEPMSRHRKSAAGGVNEESSSCDEGACRMEL